VDHFVERQHHGKNGRAVNGFEGRAGGGQNRHAR